MRKERLFRSVDKKVSTIWLACGHVTYMEFRDLSFISPTDCIISLNPAFILRILLIFVIHKVYNHDKRKSQYNKGDDAGKCNSYSSI